MASSHKLGGDTQFAVVAQHANRGDMTVQNMLILGFVILVFHLAEDVPYNLACVLIDGYLWQLSPGCHVVHPVAKVVVLWQVVEIAMLHFEKICGLRGSNANHFDLIDNY